MRTGCGGGGRVGGAVPGGVRETGGGEGRWGQGTFLG